MHLKSSIIHATKSNHTNNSNPELEDNEGNSIIPNPITCEKIESDDELQHVHIKLRKPQKPN